jgi:HK97 family phage portal protein
MKLFSRKESRSLPLLTTDDVELARALGIDLEGVSANKAKEATFFTCLRILSDNMSKLPIKMYKETSDGIQKANEHYLYSKLKLRPNKNMSSSDYWKMVEYQRNYYGHSVVVVETDPIHGKVLGLHPLEMDKVTIWVDDARIIGKDYGVWFVYQSHHGEYKFKSDQVLHFKAMTRDGITGMAIKDYLKTTVENLQYGSDYTNRFFKGGLSAKAVLQYTGDIEEVGMNRLKARFEKMANGMDNVGKILPVPVGFTFSTINSTMADAQFFENMNLSVRQIAAAFGVKQHQVNDLTGAKFNNVQQQSEEFYRDTLHPILTMYEQEMTYKLLTEEEIKAGMFIQFNVDALLRTDIKTRYEAYKVGIDGGFIMPNEAREKEDLPKAEGGDKLIVNGTMQPLEMVGMSYNGGTAPAETLKGGENE